MDSGVIGVRNAMHAATMMTTRLIVLPTACYEQTAAGESDRERAGEEAGGRGMASAWRASMSEPLKTDHMGVEWWGFELAGRGVLGRHKFTS